MNTSPSAKLAEAFRRAGGDGKPCYGKLDVCVAQDEQTARRIALETWPTSAIQGEMMQILPLPAHFEQAVANVTEDQVAQGIVCDQRPEAHIEKLRAFADAGYDRVVVQQVGAEADRFFDLYSRELLPELAGAATR